MTHDHILVDIDSVLSNAAHREPLITELGWDAFHAAGIDDAPVMPIRNLIEAHRSIGYTVLLLTARPEKWRQQTLKWLALHEINIDGLLMRADNDFRPAPIVKVDLALEYFGCEPKLKDRVALVIDDREDILKEFANMGIVTLQVTVPK